MRYRKNHPEGRSYRSGRSSVFVYTRDAFSPKMHARKTAAIFSDRYNGQILECMAKVSDIIKELSDEV